MKTYSDIATDGGSRIVEQVVEQQAKIDQNLSAVRHLVAIGSGKGGVGKSTLTMQIAFSLQRQGLAVSVLDADFNGPCLARLSGVNEAVWIPGENGFSVPATKEGVGVISFGSVFPQAQAVDFDSVSKGESYVWRATKEFSVLGEILAGAEWGKLDILLIDLPPGVERTLQFAEFFRQKTKFVLVTIPSEISQEVVSRSVTALKQARISLLGYIENMSGYFCADCKKVMPLFPSAGKTQLETPLLGSVPFDPELAALCDRGAPLTDSLHLPSAKSMREIAARLWNLLQSDSLKGKNPV